MNSQDLLLQSRVRAKFALSVGGVLEANRGPDPPELAVTEKILHDRISYYVSKSQDESYPLCEPIAMCLRYVISMSIHRCWCVLTATKRNGSNTLFQSPVPRLRTEQKGIVDAAICS